MMEVIGARVVLAGLLVATSAGCGVVPEVREAFSTKYSANDSGKKRFGIKVEDEGDGLYRILATGNQYSTGEAISDMALLRAAQIAVEQDRSHFQIIQSKDLTFRDSTRYAATPERTYYVTEGPLEAPYSVRKTTPASPAYTVYGPTLPSRGLVVHLWDASTVEGAMKETGKSAAQLKVYPAKAVYTELAATVPGNVPPLIQVFREREAALAPRYARVRGDNTREEENLRRALVRTYLDIGFASKQAGDMAGMKQAYDQALRLDDGTLRKRLEAM